MKSTIYSAKSQRALVALLDIVEPRIRRKHASDIAVLTKEFGIEYDISSDKRTKKKRRATYEVTINDTTTFGHTLQEAAQVVGLTPRSLSCYLRLRDNVYRTCINVNFAEAFRTVTIKRVFMECTATDVQAMREAG